MAVVGGMLTSAVLKTVGEQVGSAISGQIKLQWDFKDDPGVRRGISQGRREAVYH